MLIASGSHGKFVSRLDLDVRDGAVKGFRYKLIPLFADVIKPDAEMTAAVTKARAPYAQELVTRRRARLNRCFTGVAISTARSTT